MTTSSPRTSHRLERAPEPGSGLSEKPTLPHADNIAFVGGPGVGVDHASQLDVPNEHVWVARSESDIIDWTPSVKPWEWGTRIRRLCPVRPGPDRSEVRGREPGQSARQSHTDYWKEPVARDGMAHIMTGTTQHGG
ncbi:alpha/beta hydrolase [Salinifilum ghardaiensis]